MMSEDAAKRAEDLVQAWANEDTYVGAEPSSVEQRRLVKRIVIAIDAAVAEAVQSWRVAHAEQEPGTTIERLAEEIARLRAVLEHIASGNVAPREGLLPTLADARIIAHKALTPASAPEGTYPKPAKIVGRREREPLRFDDEGTGGETK